MQFQLTPSKHPGIPWEALVDHIPDTWQHLAQETNLLMYW